MKKIISLIVAIAMTAALFTACQQKPSNVDGEFAGQTLRVYNWGDYIDEKVLAIFEDETGATVQYDIFDTNESMYTKIKTMGSGSGYDVIIPSDYMIKRMTDEGLLAKIDVSSLENYRLIDARFKDLEYDPGNEYSVPYMWGTIGILYNTTLVESEPTSWDALWNPDYSQQILMMNSVRDSIGVTLKMLGYSLNSTSETHLAQAEEKLAEQKPLLLAYTLDDVKDKMIAGEAALALVYSGDAITCIDENDDLAYSVPEEGTNLWFDAMCVLENSQNKELAMAFIDFMCRTDIAAMNREFINYSSPQTEVIEALPDEIRLDPVQYPSDEIIEKSEVFVDLGESISYYDALWTRIQNK